MKTDKSCNYFGSILDRKEDHTVAELLPAKVTTLGSLSFTEWHQWTIDEQDTQFTLNQFLELLKQKSKGLECSMLVLRDANPSRTIYLDMIPTHAKRRKQSLRDLLGDDIVNSNEFVVFNTFFSLNDDDEMGPLVKYVFSNN